MRVPNIEGDGMAAGVATPYARLAVVDWPVGYLTRQTVGCDATLLISAPTIRDNSSLCCIWVSFDAVSGLIHQR